jgi:hypothetical protein
MWSKSRTTLPASFVPLVTAFYCTMKNFRSPRRNAGVFLADSSKLQAGAFAQPVSRFFGY